jgi:hypothetical protein
MKVAYKAAEGIEHQDEQSNKRRLRERCEKSKRCKDYDRTHGEHRYTETRVKGR